MVVSRFGVGPLATQCIFVVIANLTIFNFGVSNCWTSPMLPKLRDPENSPLGRPITDMESSVVTSVTFISALIFLFASAYVVDRLGRKKCLILASIPRIIGFLFLLFANKVWMLVVGRMLNGIADAFVVTVVSMYSSEIANKEIRGSLGSLLQFSSSVGILLILAAGPVIDYFTCNAIIVVICVLDTVPLLFIPESPYFLYKNGKQDEARKVLTKLRGDKLGAETEIQEYNLVPTNKAKLSELFKKKAFVKGFIISIVLGAGLQLTGFNVLAVYLQTILEWTDTSISPESASIVIGCLQPIATLISMTIIDRLGRKTLLIAGIFGTMVGMASLGTFFYLAENDIHISGFLNFLPLISLAVTVVSFVLGVLSVIWPLLAELFDGAGRAAGTTAAVVILNFLMILLSLFFVPLTNVIGASVMYWIFAVNSVIMIIFIYYYIPETKGKTFDEIRQLLEGKDFKVGGDVENSCRIQS